MLDIIYYFFWGLGGITLVSVVGILLYFIIKEYTEQVILFILSIAMTVFILSFLI